MSYLGIYVCFEPHGAWHRFLLQEIELAVLDVIVIAQRMNIQYTCSAIPYILHTVRCSLNGHRSRDSSKMCIAVVFSSS